MRCRCSIWLVDPEGQARAAPTRGTRPGSNGRRRRRRRRRISSTLRSWSAPPYHYRPRRSRACRPSMAERRARPSNIATLRAAARSGDARHVGVPRDRGPVLRRADRRPISPIASGYGDEFIAAARHTKVVLGTANTAVLLTSSACMAMAVQSTEAARPRTRGLVARCAPRCSASRSSRSRASNIGSRYQEHLVPALNFDLSAATAASREMFFIFYFCRDRPARAALD